MDPVPARSPRNVEKIVSLSENLRLNAKRWRLVHQQPGHRAFAAAKIHTATSNLYLITALLHSDFGYATLPHTTLLSFVKEEPVLLEALHT
jgi:hypothetical protein